MKKILFILHYPPPIHGAAMVGQYIRDSKHINTVFDCKYINLGTSHTVDEIGKGGILKLWRYIHILWSTVKTIIMYKPNLVYLTLTSYGKGFYKDAMIALLAKLLGKKVVYHFHNKGVKGCQHKFFDDILYKMTFKNAHVILLAKNLFDDVAKYMPENRVHYCPNGIPENENKVVDRKKTENKEKVQILFLSNLFITKGVFVLLEACKYLKEKKLPFYCVLIGGEGDITIGKLNQKVALLDIEDSVHYRGKKYDMEKEQAYAEADIFVFPTYYETFGLVNLEAMQFSLPVVSTYEGGIPDVVDDGQTGFLVPPNDGIALAKKLEILINDTELRLLMGTNGKLKYKQNYTLEKFEKRFCDILETLT